MEIVIPIAPVAVVLGTISVVSEIMSQASASALITAPAWGRLLKVSETKAKKVTC